MLKNISVKLFSYSFLITVFLLAPSAVLANSNILAEIPQDQTERLNNKIDTLNLQISENSKNSADNVIGLANNQMQLITAILALVGIGIPVFAFLFRKEIQIIEKKALVSVRNMEEEVKRIKKYELIIKKRSKEIDDLYNSYDSKLSDIEKRIKQLKSPQRKTEEEQKLIELEEEVLSIKRKLSQKIQPYTWSVSPSASGASVYPGTIGSTTYPEYTGTTTYTTTSSSHSPSSGSATTTTFDPYYPSPSPSPESDPESDENK